MQERSKQVARSRQHVVACVVPGGQRGVEPEVPCFYVEHPQLFQYWMRRPPGEVPRGQVDPEVRMSADAAASQPPLRAWPRQEVLRAWPRQAVTAVDAHHPQPHQPTTGRAYLASAGHSNASALVPYPAQPLRRISPICLLPFPRPINFLASARPILQFTRRLPVKASFYMPPRLLRITKPPTRWHRVPRHTIVQLGLEHDRLRWEHLRFDIKRESYPITKG